MGGVVNLTESRYNCQKVKWGAPLSTEWLSVEDIAKELGLTEETIRTYIRSRQLTAYRVGNTYRIKREDLNRFLERRKIPEKDDAD